MPTKISENVGGFEDELKLLLNRHSQENGSDSPDYVLARYLVRCLEAYNFAVYQREKWYGRIQEPIPFDKCPQSPDSPQTDNPAA